MEEIKKLRKEDLSTEVSSFSFSKDDIGRNAEFANRYAVMQEYAGKNHAGFVNPAVHFLSALSFLRDGNAENALAEFRILYQIMPNDPLVRRYYATLLSICRREFPAGLTAADGFDFPLDENCVYVLSAVGRSPSLKQVAVYFPLMTAWPVCEFYPQPFSGVTVLAGGRTYSSWLLADMNSIFAWEYEQRLPGIITRIVLSTAVKEGAYYGSMAAVGASDMNLE